LIQQFVCFIIDITLQLNELLILAHTDIDLGRGTVRLHPVDLLPPPDTPMIGRHDPNWDSLFKHIPPQLHGLAPPPGAVCLTL
jgi:hypothetical protein